MNFFSKNNYMDVFIMKLLLKIQLPIITYIDLLIIMHIWTKGAHEKISLWHISEPLNLASTLWKNSHQFVESHKFSWFSFPSTISTLLTLELLNNTTSKVIIKGSKETWWVNFLCKVNLLYHSFELGLWFDGSFYSTTLCI
jgi:hypothetical protein